jgi:hypothetical protein
MATFAPQGFLAQGHQYKAWAPQTWQPAQTWQQPAQPTQCQLQPWGVAQWQQQAAQCQQWQQQAAQCQQWQQAAHWQQHAAQCLQAVQLLQQPLQVQPPETPPPTYCLHGTGPHTKTYTDANGGVVCYFKTGDPRKWPVEFMQWAYEQASRVKK